MDELREVKVRELIAGEYSVRDVEEGEELDALAGSIARVGVLNPLVCVDADNGLHVIAGHRRLLAAKKIGLQVVPVLVREAGGTEGREISLAENLFRRDLTPVETAAALKDVLDAEIMSAEELAKTVDRSEAWVRRMVAMLSWPGDVLSCVHAGTISQSAAHNLAAVTDSEYRGYLLSIAAENGATARTTSAWLRAWESMAPAEEAVTREPVPPGEKAGPRLSCAPCFCCGETYRQDELVYLALCVGCVRVIRDAGLQPGGSVQG